jgi:hypothetical protein
MSDSNESSTHADEYSLTLPTGPYESAGEQKRAAADELFAAEWATALTAVAYFEALAAMHFPWAVRAARAYRRRLEESAYVERLGQLEYLQSLNHEMDQDMSCRY